MPSSRKNQRLQILETNHGKNELLQLFTEEELTARFRAAAKL
jgi:hypothetical protein